jgi:GNAT superfamily N-acetyltransferase
MMTNDVDLSVRQIRGAWRLMCGEHATHHVTGDGLEYIFSGVPVSFFNMALLTGVDVDADALKAAGAAACTWAADKQVPWLFLVTHELLEDGVDAAAMLDGCGLTPIIPMTGMVASEVADVTQVPDGLELTMPQDDAGCEAVLDVNAKAYGMDLAAGLVLVVKRSFWTDEHVACVGWANGAAASCAAVLMVDGYRYVAMVATDPAQQRRGYADAAMRRALAAAATAHGESPTVLHATDAGRQVYERMGYAPISTHTLFIEKRFLEGH